MRVLMVYDTVSEAKVTGKVAGAIADAMKGAGVPVETYFVNDANKVNVRDYDCLILGAPTMAWRPSKRMKDFLAGLAGTDLTGKLAATFDTQLKSSISGNATKHMERGLSDLGLKIISPALIAYVEDENKVYRLKDGEMEKVKAWASGLATLLAR